MSVEEKVIKFAGSNGMKLLTPSSFKGCSVYTCTIGAVSNLKINITLLYDLLPVQEVRCLSRKRGKKSIEGKVQDGSIISIKYKDKDRRVHLRGVNLKKTLGCFSNAVCIVMYVDNKYIDIKIAGNGKFNFTGCLSVDQAKKGMRYLFSYLQDLTKAHQNIYSIKDGQSPEVPEVLFNHSMININFELGYKVDRKKIHKFLYENTSFIPLTEALSYAGVIVKRRLGHDNPDIPKMVYKDEKWHNSKLPWDEYFKTLTEKEKKKVESKEKCHTFLIFHSGKVIQSGPCYDRMEKVFGELISSLNENREKFEVVDKVVTE